MSPLRVSPCRPPAVTPEPSQKQKTVYLKYCDTSRCVMEKILDFRHFGILISGFAYAIIAVGKRENKSMRTKKNEALSTANTEGFFLLFIVDRKTTRLVLSLFVSI